MPLLNVFRLRDLDGDPTATFDRYVDADDIADWDVEDYSDDLLAARLYLPPASTHNPGWRDFVITGFPEARVRTVRTVRALVICCVWRYRKHRYFAITFGHARHMLSPDLIEPGFGLRTALNILYDDAPPGISEDQLDRIRQIDARTIESNVRRQRVQRSRDAVFEAYGIAPERDLLDRIVGAPPDHLDFGSRITGGNSLALHKDLEFAELGSLLRRLLAVHGRSTYKTHFAWLDKVVPVTDARLLDRLHDYTVALVTRPESPLDIAPPTIFDWAAVDHFSFSFGGSHEHQDVDLQTYIDAVTHSRVRELDINRLKSQRIIAWNGDRTKIAQWSVSKCLSGTFRLGGQTFVLDEGHYYEVDPGYLNELDAFLLALPAPKVSLPATTADQPEDKYNKAAASASDSVLLLDKKTIRPTSATSAIEICDLLTTSGEFVHVKRKLASSTLSHMFAQGFVSAEALQSDTAYRNSARRKIKEQAEAQGKDVEAFRSLVTDPLAASKLTVVYAVLANWDGQKPVARLPFFSKVNMRHCVRQLERMGFQTAFAAVDAR